uniref:Uncharacterized protein n=1 Tax=Kuetzingia canaliculata TaxID=228262 RepID=A0A1Z1MP86_KUECA|nr:hypothetical protein [Kuetzingia canaliculata]ARW67907.1 hypothetical protein [Kuetzingia canaliculata]
MCSIKYFLYEHDNNNKKNVQRLELIYSKEYISLKYNNLYYLYNHRNNN